VQMVTEANQSRSASRLARANRGMTRTTTDSAGVTTHPVWLLTGRSTRGRSADATCRSPLPGLRNSSIEGEAEGGKCVSRNRPKTRGLAALGLLVVCWAAHWVPLEEKAFAQGDKPPRWTSIRVGFDDDYKVGTWTPVTLTLRGGSRQLTGFVTLTVPDGDGVPSAVTTFGGRPVMVLPGRETTVRLFARFGRVDSTARAEFMVDGEIAAAREFETSFEADGQYYLDAMEADRRLYVLAGARTIGLAELVEAEPYPMSTDQVARINSIDLLPTRWFGYEGVEAVILGTSRPEFYRSLADGSPRLEALDHWVRQGGRLVFCVGRQGAEILAPQSPLRRFAPGNFTEMVTLRQSGALESFVNADSPLLRPAAEKVLGRQATELRVPRLKETDGVVAAREADVPLIVRSAHGLGEVVFVALDLDRAPLADWADRGDLVRLLLDREAPPQDDEETGMAYGYGYGYQDLTGQLRGTLDQFEGVRLVPFSIVALLIIVYILLIGPGDFLFVRHVLRRMEFTWLTFPVIIVGVSLGAYWLAYWLKGDQLRMNQVDLVDVDVSSGLARGTTWTNIFSPRVEAFDLSLRPTLTGGAPASNTAQPSQSEVLLSWLGLPGGAMGGMNPRAAGPSPFARSYSFGPRLSNLRAVPIQVWSSKSFVGRYLAQMDATVSGELIQTDRGLVGHLTNDLGVALTNCALIHGDWVYLIDRLPAGNTFALTDEIPRADLTTWFTNRSYVQTDQTLQTQSESYETESTDPGYVLRTMMFYEAAGGRQYAGGLTNTYQKFVDLSHLIDLNRAVLLARLPEGYRAAEFLRGDEPVEPTAVRSPTFCRFVFHVEQTEEQMGEQTRPAEGSPTAPPADLPVHPDTRPVEPQATTKTPQFPPLHPAQETP